MAAFAAAAARLLPLLGLLALLHLMPAACDAADSMHQEPLLDTPVYHWPAFSSGRRLQAADPTAAEAAAKAHRAKVMAPFRPVDKLKDKAAPQLKQQAVALPTAGVPQVAALPASTVELKAEDTTWQAELDSLFDDPTAAAQQAEGTSTPATEPKAAATEVEQPPAAAAAAAPAPAKQEPAAKEQQELPAAPVDAEEPEQPAAAKQEPAAEEQQKEQPAAPVAVEEAPRPAAAKQEPAADEQQKGQPAAPVAVEETPKPAAAKQEPAADEQQKEQPAAPVAVEEAPRPAADAQKAAPQPAADSNTPGSDAFKQAVNEAVNKVLKEMLAKGTLRQAEQPQQPQQQQPQQQVPKRAAPAPFAGRFVDVEQPGVDAPAAAAKPQAPLEQVSSGDAGSLSKDEQELLQQQQPAINTPAAATDDHPDKQPQAVSTPEVNEAPKPAAQLPVAHADPPKPAVIVTPAPKAPAGAKKGSQGSASQMQQQLLGGMFGGIFGETKLPTENGADITARDIAAAPTVGLFAGGQDMTQALQLLMLSEKQRKANLAQRAQQALLPPHIATAPAAKAAPRKKAVDPSELLNNMFGF